MRHKCVETLPQSSSLKNAYRIRELLDRIWDTREGENEDARTPMPPRLWWELEELVAQELKSAEELALQD